MLRVCKKRGKINSPQKWRHIYPIERNELHWGVAGIKLLESFMIIKKRIYWFKRWVKWHYNTRFLRSYSKWRIEPDFRKYRRYLWVHTRNAIPCRRKSSKHRMGKGRGKLALWYSRLNAGAIFVEFKYFDISLLKNLHNYLKKRLSVKSHLILTEEFRNYTTPGLKYRYLPYTINNEVHSYWKLLKYIKHNKLRLYKYTDLQIKH